MSTCATTFDLPKLERQIQELEAQLGDSQVWEDPAKAQRLTAELSQFRGLVGDWQELVQALEEAEVAAELAEADDDSSVEEANRYFQLLESKLERAETLSLLQGEYDSAPAILTLHAGAGGVDAQDWTEMLLHMYSRWAEKNGYQVTLAEYSPAEEDGIHSATLLINGFYPFGMLSSERGVHRLVRISPYDAAHRRHTSFAKVEVVPELNDQERL